MLTVSQGKKADSQSYQNAAAFRLNHVANGNEFISHSTPVWPRVPISSRFSAVRRNAWMGQKCHPKTHMTPWRHRNLETAQNNDCLSPQSRRFRDFSSKTCHENRKLEVINYRLVWKLGPDPIMDLPNSTLKQRNATKSWRSCSRGLLWNRSPWLGFGSTNP